MDPATRQSNRTKLVEQQDEIRQSMRNYIRTAERAMKGARSKLERYEHFFKTTLETFDKKYPPNAL